MRQAAPNQPLIEVRPLSESDPLEFDVKITEAASETRHRVTMAAADYQRLAGGSCRPEQCVEAAVRFLLEREPKESILRRFDIRVIARYFPEFETQLPRYLTGAG